MQRIIDGMETSINTLNSLQTTNAESSEDACAITDQLTHADQTIVIQQSKINDFEKKVKAIVSY